MVIVSSGSFVFAGVESLMHMRAASCSCYQLWFNVAAAAFPLSCHHGDLQADHSWDDSCRFQDWREFNLQAEKDPPKVKIFCWCFFFFYFYFFSFLKEHVLIIIIVMIYIFIQWLTNCIVKQSVVFTVGLFFQHFIFTFLLLFTTFICIK